MGSGRSWAELRPDPTSNVEGVEALYGYAPDRILSTIDLVTTIHVVEHILAPETFSPICCLEMILSHQIVDSLSIVALLAYHTLRTGQTQPIETCHQPMSAAIFLDRDGVLIKDVHLLTNPADIRVLEGVPQALTSLKEAGFKLIVISNQTVVAHGLVTEQEVYAINAEMERLLEQAGGPHLDGFYFCPHHPNATLPAYRIACECRKPRPGLLLRAARQHNLNLGASFVVGDRITDIIAGARAGCRTVLVQTGKHQAPPIETVEPLDESVQPDHVFADLKAMAEWILGAG